MDEVTADRIASALEGIERHLADLAAKHGAQGPTRNYGSPFVQRERARRTSVESDAR